jgi:hypothetical protein
MHRKVVLAVLLGHVEGLVGVSLVGATGGLGIGSMNAAIGFRQGDEGLLPAPPDADSRAKITPKRI